MSTRKTKLTVDIAVANIPTKFRSRITKYYRKIREEYSRGSFDSSGLNNGKYCESVLRFLQFRLTGAFTPFGNKLTNFHGECQKLTNLSKSSGVESLRVVIPRALQFLYTMRNKRGIGHVGGDVDENKIDSVTLVRLADWVFCELIRVEHGLSLEEAQEIVDTISDRILPDVWEIADHKVVLRTGLSMKQKVLLLCYSCFGEHTFVDDVFKWTKHTNASVFRQKVLKPLVRDNYIHIDKDDDIIYISPLGVREVEEVIIAK